MAPSSRSRPARRCLTALLLSLALHGLLGGTLAYLPARNVGGAPAGPACRDTFDPTDDTAPGDGTSYLVAGSEAPRPAPAVPPPVAAAPNPPLPRLPALTGALDPLPALPAAPVFPQGQAGTGASPAGSVPATPAVPGQGAATGKASATFFQVPSQGNKVVYVIDRSASMGMNRALTVARNELLASLGELPPTARFQVIVYNATASALLPGSGDWLAPTPENKGRVAHALGELRPEGGTRHELALPTALALQPDAVFFLTDADDLPAEHLRAVTRRNAGRAVIHVIELSTANEGRPEMPLQTLARANRGLYRAVDLQQYRY